MRLRAQTATALRFLAAEEPLDVVVSGECMAPHLECGDRIQVSPRRLYLPGDIVAFRRDDNRLLVHRILGYTLSRHGFRLLAKGDRLSREDEPIALDNVVGQVVARHGTPIGATMPERGRSLFGYIRVLLRRSLAPWRSATSS